MLLLLAFIALLANHPLLAAFLAFLWILTDKD